MKNPDSPWGRDIDESEIVVGATFDFLRTNHEITKVSYSEVEYSWKDMVDGQDRYYTLSKEMFIAFVEAGCYTNFEAPKKQE